MPPCIRAAAHFFETLMTRKLNEQLADLHETRVRTWPPAQLKVNVEQRRELIEAFDPSTVIGVGEPFPDFELKDVNGGTITLPELIADGPAVLIFFRFAGCPACNIALPAHERELWPGLTRSGVPLVAISPQVPERLKEIRDRHSLSYRVASDPDNRLARQIGITYHANVASRGEGERPGWIGEVTGTMTWELPQPTAVILREDGRVAFIDVSPDWLVRTEPAAILDAIASVRTTVAV
jgi:peroxiredoxin